MNALGSLTAATNRGSQMIWVLDPLLHPHGKGCGKKVYGKMSLTRYSP